MTFARNLHGVDPTPIRIFRHGPEVRHDDEFQFWRTATDLKFVMMTNLSFGEQPDPGAEIPRMDTFLAAILSVAAESKSRMS